MFTGTWSMGVAWDITNEKWFKVDWITFLKIRYSIGNPGNQNFDAYMSSGIYEYNPDYTNIFGESAILLKSANRNLAWQKTLDQNIGLDFTVILLTFTMGMIAFNDIVIAPAKVCPDGIAFDIRYH